MNKKKKKKDLTQKFSPNLQKFSPHNVCEFVHFSQLCYEIAIFKIIYKNIFINIFINIVKVEYLNFIRTIFIFKNIYKNIFINIFINIYKDIVAFTLQILIL